MNVNEFHEGKMYELILKDDSDAIAAQILAVHEKQLIVKVLSKYGKQDGFQYLLADQIEQSREQSEYIASVERLSRYYAETPVQEPEADRADLVHSFLMSAFGRNRIIRIELLDSEYWDVTGRITEITEQSVVLECVGEYGEYDGQRIISMDVITRIDYDDCECRRLEILTAIRHTT